MYAKFTAKLIGHNSLLWNLPRIKSTNNNLTIKQSRTNYRSIVILPLRISHLRLFIFLNSRNLTINGKINGAYTWGIGGYFACGGELVGASIRITGKLPHSFSPLPWEGGRQGVQSFPEPSLTSGAHAGVEKNDDGSRRIPEILSVENRDGSRNGIAIRWEASTRFPSLSVRGGLVATSRIIINI